MANKLIDCNNCGSSEYKILGSCFDKSVPDFLGKEFNIVVCSRCGLTFINPQPSDDNLKKYYQKHNYTFNPRGKFTYNKARLIEDNIFHDFCAKFLAKHVDPHTHPKVLDYGCGFGSFLFYLEKYGYQPEGLEPNLNVAIKVRETFGYNVYNSTLNNNNIPPESYDVVTGIGVMEHSSNPTADIKDVRRLLKNNGYLYLVVPNLESIVLNKGWNKYFKFVHTYYFSIKTLSSILEQSGFEISFLWNISPVIKYCSFIFPENFTHGMICVIARKIDIAVAKSSYGDKPEEPFIWVKKAKKRDFFYTISKKIESFIFGLPIIGLPIRIAMNKLKKDSPYKLDKDSPFNNIP